jgi:tRNA-dihydrouridine synthase B
MSTIYFAPVQGFTDFVYRKAYSEIFQGIDTFFIPYITTKNGEVLKKYFKEILPENNLQNRVIPQVLASDSNEILFLSGLLSDYGYNEINLNLSNRKKGSGLLPYPDMVKEILTGFFENSKLSLSVKLRAGLTDFSEIDILMPLLNDFPLTEIIFHPRIASQLYGGDVNEEKFAEISRVCKHKLVYNGDVFTKDQYSTKQDLFPETNTWMLGRGILMNSFLPAEIKGIPISDEEKRKKLIGFHERLMAIYLDKMDNASNVADKMKQFWIYFSYCFQDQHKVLKRIKKSGNLRKYQNETAAIFKLPIC